MNKFKIISVFLLLSIVLYPQTSKMKTFERIINKNIPPSTIVVTEISSDSIIIYYAKVFRIDIFNSRTKKLLQSFNHETTMGKDYFLNIEFLGNAFGHESDTNLIDLDSDGYKDLLLLNGNGDMGRNYNYTPYFYDYKNNKFITNEKLPDIINPDVDAENKTFSEHISQGCYSNCFTESTFKMINGIPIVLEQIVQHPDNGDINFLITDTYHFKNGERIKIKSEKFQFIK